MRFESCPPILGMSGYSATAGKWQFMILRDGHVWTMSYRLRGPREEVSASSTIQLFESFEDAAAAAEEMHQVLRRQN